MLKCWFCGKVCHVRSIIRSLRFEENGIYIVTLDCPKHHQQGLDEKAVREMKWN